MALTKEQLDKLPESVRAQLKGASVRERKYEKEIISILKAQDCAVGLDEMIAYMFLDHSQEVERVAFNSTLNALAKDGKIFKLIGKKAMFSLNEPKPALVEGNKEEQVEEVIKSAPKPIRLNKRKC